MRVVCGALRRLTVQGTVYLCYEAVSLRLLVFSKRDLASARLSCKSVQTELNCPLSMTLQAIHNDIMQHPKCPYRTDGYFPNQFKRYCYRLKNTVHNQLYPVSPFLFSTLFCVTAAIVYKNPPKWITHFIFDKGFSLITSILLIAVISTYLPVLLVKFLIKHVFFGYKDHLFEKSGQHSLNTKIWFMFYGLFIKLSPRLLSCVKLLPTLPLPPLKQTIAKYLESVEPLLSPNELSDVRNIAENFLKNEGWKIQGLAWLYWCFVDNYVSNFWEKYAYHYSRKGLLINSSVAHLDLFNDKPANQAVRAAHVVYLEVLSMLSIDRESVRPVANGLIGLTHLWKCYCTTRVPGEIVDHLKVHSLQRHVAVYHCGCIYKVEVFDENDRLFSVEELTEIFMELLTRDESVEETEGHIAALTTDCRDRWCLNRRRFFLENSLNSASLATIESAIFYLVLDDANYSTNPEHPEMLENFFKNMLTGNGCNRWADKSLNYVVAANGRVSITLIASFYSLFSQELRYPEKVEEIKRPKERTGKIKYATRVNFDINEEMKEEIMRCYAGYQKQINDVDVASVAFRDFGKGLIKEGGISPDAFVQMAIQLASFKDQGKFCLTYESASTRFFANSRTETLRSVTRESSAFVRSMLSSKCSKEERLRLLKQAAEVHILHNRECMIGKGVDRHLFVLYVLSKMISMRSEFLDYYIAQPWQLSTSQAPNMTQQIDEDSDPDMSWFGAGFGAVCKNGYGICYRFAGNHSICIHITSYKSAENTDSHRLQQHLLQSFHEMSALFRD